MTNEEAKQFGQPRRRWPTQPTMSTHNWGLMATCVFCGALLLGEASHAACGECAKQQHADHAAIAYQVQTPRSLFPMPHTHGEDYTARIMGLAEISASTYGSPPSGTADGYASLSTYGFSL